MAYRFGRYIFSLYESHPILLNSVIGGTVYFAGELTAQVNQSSPQRKRELSESATSPVSLTKKLQWHVQKIDWSRAQYLGALGAVENGIFMLTWYKFLNKVFGSGVSTKTVVLKSVCDQIFFATQQDLLFLAICAYQDSEKYPEAVAEVSRTFLPTWLMDCALWPMVNFIGFSVVPCSIQPSYMAAVQFFWQVYISSVASKDECEHKHIDVIPVISKEEDMKLHAVFRRIDADSSGFIDANELSGELTRRYKRKISSTELANIIKEVDINGDNQISYDEFKRAIYSGAANQTSLWSSLRDELTLKKGAQAAISRYNNLHKHDNDVAAAAKTQSAEPLSSTPSKDSDAVPNNQSTAAASAVPSSDVTDSSKTDSNNEDVREALKSAGFGFFMFASASIIRKAIFKV